MFPAGYRRPVRRADNLTAFMCRLCRSLEPHPPGSLSGLYRDCLNDYRLNLGVESYGFSQRCSGVLISSNI